ncbi:unnamed protein product [Rotaria sp. Silwood1]|nr:unnamed protein product [Rotaria sp. Silwood1]
MNLSNIAKHLLYLTKNEYGSENSATTTDTIFAAERLFEVFKSFKNSYFNELYTYDTLEFDDEYDEMIDEEESDDEIDDYNENEHSDIKNRFTLAEMENIIEWVAQHPNAGLTTISHRFKKVYQNVCGNTQCCSDVSQAQSPAFLKFQVKDQIHSILASENNFTLHSSSSSCYSNCITDIQHANWYQSIALNEDTSNFITLFLNVDGISMSDSSDNSLWIFTVS